MLKAEIGKSMLPLPRLSEQSQQQQCCPTLCRENGVKDWDHSTCERRTNKFYTSLICEVEHMY